MHEHMHDCMCSAVVCSHRQAPCMLPFASAMPLLLLQMPLPLPHCH